MATNLVGKQEFSVKVVVTGGNAVSRATLEAALVTAINTATSGTSHVEVTSGGSTQDIAVSKIHNGKG